MLLFDSVEIRPSTRAAKRLMAVFRGPLGLRRTVHFGQPGATTFADMPQRTDEEQEAASQRRLAYMRRHRKGQNWEAPATAGALSRYVLWEMPGGWQKGAQHFKDRFGLR